MTEARLEVEDRLEALHRRIREDRACPLLEERVRAVQGEGPAGARVVFVGEAPGTREEALGRPLVGNAGRVFDRLLESIGLDRAGVYVTNAIKCRPPGNRAPRAAEVAHCRGFLDEALAVIEPAVVCPMGAAALKMVLGPKASITDLHGRPLERDGRWIFPLLHPAAWFYREALKAAIEDDFRRLGAFLRERGWERPD